MSSPDRTEPDLPALLPGAAWLDFGHVVDARGSLVFAEEGRHLPFTPRRVFFIADVPPDGDRGFHAHHRCALVLVAACGGFDLVLEDAAGQRQTVRLDRPQRGLHVGPGLWHELHSFLPGTLCLVLASHGYDEADYIRDHAAFRRGAGQE